MRVSIIAIVLACFALSVSAEESSIDVQLGRTNQASVLPWMLSTPSMNKVVRRVVFTDVSQASLAREVLARGHSVFWAAAEEAPQGASRLELAPLAGSTFGELFDRSLQLYNTLKAVKNLDVVVFKNGAAYMSLEGKQSGMAFEKTALVVLVSEALAERKLDLPEHVTAFMDERAVELADMVFLYDESLVAQARFTVAVTAWKVEGSAVALLESARSSMEPLPKVPEALVTVVLASYNRPEMLRQAVASIQAQTYKNIEILVVDDGSTLSEMKKVLADLEGEGVRVVRQENQYLGAARNNGARVAKGTYIVFLDDDNLALPAMVSSLVTAARRSDAKIAVNGHYIWRASETDTMPSDFSRLKSWCPVGPAVMAGLKGNVFGNANFLIAKDTFFALSGFTEDRAGWEDYEFHAKSAIAGVSYVVVPEPLMLYRIHSNTEQMSQMAENLNFQRVKRAYKSLLEESSNVMRGDYIADDRFDGGERVVTGCSVQTVTGSCTNVTITVSVQASGTGVNYLGTASTPSVYVNGIAIPGSQYSWVAPVGTNEAGTWTITGTPPNSVNPAQQFTVAVEFTGGTVCTPATVNPGTISCGTCFHKDTVVTYEGREMGKSELEQHSDCRIPHVVRSRGVVVHTTCADKPLRLTADHLVFTAKGTRAASALVAGDVVYGDLEQQRPCTVKSVERESTEQEYFGLNCLRSAVLADKVKTSTFGNMHTLPSLWMSYVGRIFGIARASAWGDVLANWAHRANLL